MSIVRCTDHGLIDTDFDAEHFIYGTEQCAEFHEHTNTHVEEVEVNTMWDGEHDTYTDEIYVCDDCGETLEGSPQADRAEALADMEQDRYHDDG